MFLHEVMGLALSAEDVATLEARTEGWIAGLQLAALSLRDRRDAQQAEFIAAFTGSNRFVVDYLLDEVLTRQPAHLQTFLLQTSILERLSGPLCDAVVLGDEAEPQQARGTTQQAYTQPLLEELERGNLFIVPLDDERRWYRYHHLFVQVLRERLVSGASEEAVASLHRRASLWFEQHGLLPEAMEHLFAAQEWGQGPHGCSSSRQN
jgi:LuxR family maltose regulon positive regulatory protein